MNKKLTAKLLTLHKETLRNLSEKDLKGIQGGGSVICTCGTSSTVTLTDTCFHC